MITVEAVQFGPYPTTLSLFANALFWLLLLLACNELLRRFAARWSLSRSDLLTAYCMLTVSSAITGCDLLQILMHYIGHPVWSNTVRPGYSDSFLKHVPSWLTVTDPAALKGYYDGNASPFRWSVLIKWLVPLASWMLFVAMLAVSMLSANALLRKRWAEHERLPFPLVSLPLDLVTKTRDLHRNRLLWSGFAVAGGIDLWNGIAYLFPTLWQVPVNYTNLQPLFPDKPWSAMGWTTVSFYPIVIGIGFLLPLDLLFSFWFFFLFWKAQPVIASAMAWDARPDFPYTAQQGYGAALAIGLSVLWGARRYLYETLRRACGKRGESDSDEAWPYRRTWAAWALSSAGLAVFAVLAGMRWWVAAVFIGLYLLVLLVVTRIRAEFGAPVHDFINAAPEVALADTLGPRAFTANELTAMSLFYSFTKLHRSDPMPHAMEALKLAEEDQSSRRSMTIAVFAALLFGAAAGMASMLLEGYRLGNAAQWSFPAYAGWETFDRLNGWLNSPELPDPDMGTAMGAGALGCLALVLCRQAFLWWPFHPIGFVVTATFQANLVWVPLLIAWALKSLALRWGGRALYLRYLPFFYGLILGQVVVGSFWSLVSVFTGMRMYSFWGY